MSKLESKFQAELINELTELFPGCFILKNDSGYAQGIPDLLVLFRSKWAMLEVKASAHASHQPNQDYYIDLFDQMSYGAFIFPENKEEILRELQSAFGTRRVARPSVRQ